MGNIKFFNAIRVKYQPIDHAIRIKASIVKDRAKSIIGNYIILNSHDHLNVGHLIELRLDIKGGFKHRFNYYNRRSLYKNFILIGQVMGIIDSHNAKYKTLIRILDIKAKPISMDFGQFS